ncbi:MAG: HAMP domain-containing histidine kinase [Anaerolineales bacterium]|nr:HAMP domain-containing histidine kinase [Anaerolineales bacterium]MCX7754840.1 HAMP domain-containing histidine kinase [Anaerolineales bacterium]MDW8277785.1 HAMP domain-containing sensor histidine kinase [Anaerolineales bacterium]
MSIRLRFALLYSAILAVILAFIGLAIYGILSRVTYAALQDDLRRASFGLGEAILSANSLDVQIPPVTGRPPRAFSEFPEDRPFRDLREREIVRILDPLGSLLASPMGRLEDALPLEERGLTELQAGRDWWQIATVNGQTMLIYNRPLAQNGQVLYILQVARSLEERNRSLGFFGLSFGGLSLFIIVTALGVGWLFSGALLRPIVQITQTAQTIGQERDFSHRVQYRGPQDEVGKLAATFNNMLAQLQEAYDKVAHSLQMQRDFVADVSHELRTPLTTLRGNLGLLQRQPPLPAQEQAEILSDMAEESDRLIRLVNDLLTLARADAGRNLAREALELAPILEETCRQARALDPAREISLETAPLTILGDRDALKQVLLIGLDNALKHSTGRVWVTAHRNGSQAEIQIRDEGPGIPPETLPHIFDRFYRGEESLTVPGFGLGLPIAKALTENMGGTIAMESEVGRGSTLKMLFPLSPG